LANWVPVSVSAVDESGEIVPSSIHSALLIPLGLQPEAHRGSLAA
jgi:hypothetical protein